MGADGSSPLTRGKPRTGATLDGIGGLIPAHAGKTLSFRRPDATAGGSSPLTRGKLDFHDLFSLVIGLIPAHAGKT